MKVNVVVSNYHGLIDEVEVFAESNTREMAKYIVSECARLECPDPGEDRTEEHDEDTDVQVFTCDVNR